MPKYIDGFVLPVKKKDLKAYKKMAIEGAKAWRRHGAVAYFECVGEDLTPPQMGGMKAVQFTKLAKAKPGETVFFSFIIYKSRAHRDLVNKKVIAEMTEYMQKQKKPMKMPFDPKRMAYGGFEVMVEA